MKFCKSNYILDVRSILTDSSRLFNTLLALRDSLNLLLKNSTDKRTIIENYDLVSLAIDEIVS